MNADEIVRALRCVEEKHRNDRLLTFQTDVSAMARDAAELIESLQAQHKQAALNYQQKCRDVVELEAQLFRVTEVKNALESDLINTNGNLEHVTAQLTTSQRREKAAVECLNVLEPCDFCKHYDENCICARPLDYGNCFEWRGPQEAEEGENNA